MSDIAQTAALVVALDNPAGNIFEDCIGDEVIAAGQPVYLSGDAIDLKVKKAHAVTSNTTALVRGIAMNSVLVAGQPVRIMKRGLLNPGFTGAASTIAILSGANAGGIAPASDLVTTWRASILGVMPAAAQLAVDFITTAFQTSAPMP